MKLRVVGGGLAGCEAAYQLLIRGFEVELIEMRGKVQTPCHKTSSLAELVCSNSLKSELDTTASGLLKKELNVLGSLLLELAYQARVPAGSALAVDRQLFSSLVENRLKSFDKFSFKNEEYTDIDDTIPTIIATGPLTSDTLANKLSKFLNTDDDLYFYDALAPIILKDSLDTDIIFEAARYNKGDASDYLNIGLNKEQYLEFYNNLVNAESVILKDFEKGEIFENCMPIEVLAKRGIDSMRFGPMKPVGIYDKNGKRYYAVVQLRKENISAEAYNIVGFQTNLKYKEQKRVFSLLPGMENVEFLRYGVMHRNTYLNSPKYLDATFKLRNAKNIFLAGQLTGVEGYVESIASGLIAAINLALYIKAKEPYVPPRNTICGALCRHISNVSEKFEPMNANFGILEDINRYENGKKIDKSERKLLFTKRAMNELMSDVNLNRIREV